MDHDNDDDNDDDDDDEDGDEKHAHINTHRVTSRRDLPPRTVILVDRTLSVSPRSLS